MEASALFRELNAGRRQMSTFSVTDAITDAAQKVALQVGAKAIVVFTKSGTTVLRASRDRPGVPILAVLSSYCEQVCGVCVCVSMYVCWCAFLKWSWGCCTTNLRCAVPYRLSVILLLCLR